MTGALFVALRSPQRFAFARKQQGVIITFVVLLFFRRNGLAIPYGSRPLREWFKKFFTKK